MPSSRAGSGQAGLHIGKGKVGLEGYDQGDRGRFFEPGLCCERCWHLDGRGRDDGRPRRGWDWLGAGRSWFWLRGNHLRDGPAGVGLGCGQMLDDAASSPDRSTPLWPWARRSRW